MPRSHVHLEAPGLEHGGPGLVANELAGAGKPLAELLVDGVNAALDDVLRVVLLKLADATLLELLDLWVGDGDALCHGYSHPFGVFEERPRSSRGRDSSS